MLKLVAQTLSREGEHMMNTLKACVGNLRIHIAYVGVGAVGKTTTLRYIHAKLPPEVKGEIVSQEINEYDRLLFFDLVMPDMGTIGGNIPQFRVQWLGGAVYYYGKSHQDLLMDVGAIVFIMDSQSDRLDANLEMLEGLSHLLRQQNQTIEDIPWVIQYNKRDLPNILSVNDLQRQFNRYNVPYFETIAPQGIGVMETLQAVLRLAVVKAQKDQAL
jgi:mutual gliding-motility protein MglA